MTLPVRLAVTLAPFVGAGWAAVRFGASGAAGGVIWCDVVVALVASALVVAAYMEARVDG